MTAIERLYFEDVAVGDQFVGATVAVEREELLWFARNFDNQPMHTDPAAARAMGLEDIIAPGCYTFALNSKSIHVIWNRLHFLPSGRDIALCLLKPLYAGGTLTTYVEIGGKRESSKPVRGWLDAKVTCRDGQPPTGQIMRGNHIRPEVSALQFEMPPPAVERNV